MPGADAGFHFISGTETPVKAPYTLRSFEDTAALPIDDISELLRAQGEEMIGVLAEISDVIFSPETPISAFAAQRERFVPPEGRYFLAYDTHGTAIAAGGVRRVKGTIGELKHAYVAPAWRGRGLGRALIEARLTAARELGFTAVTVDAFRNNHAILALYDRMGFERAAPFPHSGTLAIMPELADFGVFLRKTL